METIFSLAVFSLFIWVAYKMNKRFPNTITPMSIHAKDAEREIKTGVTPLTPIATGTALSSKEEKEWQSIVSDFEKF